MSWTQASQGVSATPATALYDTIVALMTSWTLEDTVTAANAGTVADVKVWKAPGSDWYLIFEPDDTNNRLRMRVTYQYTAGTDRVKRFIGFASSATSTTPTADYSINDTDQTIVTAGYAQVAVNSTGFTYYIGVGAGNGSSQDLIYMGASGGVSGVGTGVMAGFFTPINANDTHPLFLWSQVQTSNTTNQWLGLDSGQQGSVRVSHEYGSTSLAAGNSCYTIAALRLSGCIIGAFGNFYGNARNAFTTDGLFAFDAFFHGTNSTAANIGRINGAVGGSSYTAERGSLPDFKCGSMTQGTQAILGDTAIIDGVTYTFLGNAGSYGATCNSVAQVLMVDTATAFA